MRLTTWIRITEPGEYRKELYKQYLNSDDWKELRGRALARDGYKCSECSSTRKPLEVHHTSYKNLGNPREINDLVVLCRICHQRKHNAKPK